MMTSIVFVDLHAQDSRFNAGIVVGVNFSELEGDEITVIMAPKYWLMGTFRMSKHSQLGMELLFSQNGDTFCPNITLNWVWKVWLNHIEIPVHIDWLIGVFQRDNFYDWNLNLGVAYTRLIGFHAEDIDKTDVTDQVTYKNKVAYLLQPGTTYHFTKSG
ncbi:MAG: hypothetical protein IPM82_28170 [Saprospiraceae bacterium]|nr:hypothetical protein [Saprospiraceae bacterium]